MKIKTHMAEVIAEKMAEFYLFNGMVIKEQSRDLGSHFPNNTRMQGETDAELLRRNAVDFFKSRVFVDYVPDGVQDERGVPLLGVFALIVEDEEVSQDDAADGIDSIYEVQVRVGDRAAIVARNGEDYDEDKIEEFKVLLFQALTGILHTQITTAYYRLYTRIEESPGVGFLERTFVFRLYRRIGFSYR